MNIFDYNINPLVNLIGKEPCDFTKKDLINYVVAHDVRMVNFRYAAADGRLKTLNLPISNLPYLDTLLSYGERVDGSSLFPYIESGSSDLYVIPRYATAYVDPFAQVPTLGLLCSFFTKDGLPLDTAPEYTLAKAHRAFSDSTGLQFEAMGELEFYLVSADDGRFPTPDQRGYHESTPFTKFEAFRVQAMQYIARAGGQIKYAHSEVGNFTHDGKIYEQNEIEFLVSPVVSAADQLMLAKWILRTLAYQHGLDITFAPKITVGKAGSGLHFHTRFMKDNASVMIENGTLSQTARTAIAGYMKCASSLTAFGNTNPTSYFRLVPHQEAPTTICWGDRNRSVLVRVPLGWTGSNNMAAQLNPKEGLPTSGVNIASQKQTVELRSPDGSADIYLTLAGLVTAARIGFESEDALQVAQQTYVDVNVHHDKTVQDLEQLPASCAQSADCLEAHRHLFEAQGVFNPALIDGTLQHLRSYGDAHIREEIIQHPGKMAEMVQRFYYCG